MTSKEIGNIGMTRVALKFMELGYSVFSEMGDNSDIDLIVVKDNMLLKLQVKTTQKITNQTMTWVIAKARMNTKHIYKAFYDETIDGYCLYCLENDYIGYIPFKDCNSHYNIKLRLAKPKNNQEKNIKYAKDYELQNTGLV